MHCMSVLHVLCTLHECVLHECGLHVLWLCMSCSVVVSYVVCVCGGGDNACAQHLPLL